MSADDDTAHRNEKARMQSIPLEQQKEDAEHTKTMATPLMMTLRMNLVTSQRAALTLSF